MPDKMIIVYSCSKLYEKYAEKSIESVLKYNPDAEIVIITREELSLPFKQIFIEQDREVLDGHIHPSWEGNAKLFITQLPYSKVIYLGADTKVVRKPVHTQGVFPMVVNIIWIMMTVVFFRAVNPAKSRTSQWYTIAIIKF